MHSTTPIAENHICISRALFNEGIRATRSKTYQQAIKKLVIFLLAIYLAVAVWLCYTGTSLLFLAGESVFLGALLFWLVVMLPHTRSRSKYRAMAQNGSSPRRTVRFYQEHLTVLSDTHKETEIPYKDITCWHETKNLYLLLCSNHTCVLLDKNGFTVGNFQTVKTFLGFPDQNL